MSSIPTKLKTLLLLFFCISLSPTMSFAQRIEIRIASTYTVAGNGINNPGGTNNGEVLSK